MTKFDLKTRFDQQGLVLCQSFLDSNQLKTLAKNLSEFIDTVVPKMPNEQVFYEDKSKPESLKQIQRLHEQTDYFEKLMCDSPFRNLAEQLLGTKVTCENMQYFNKPPGIGQPTPAHQDGYYFKLNPCLALTMWLALDHVDEENGCVRYVPGSHKGGMRPHDATGTLGFSQGISDFPNDSDRQKEIAFPAKPGDLLCHHALTIHRADGNQSATRSRRALGFIYYSVDARQDKKAWELYQQKLKQELESTGKI